MHEATVRRGIHRKAVKRKPQLAAKTLSQRSRDVAQWRRAPHVHRLLVSSSAQTNSIKPCGSVGKDTKADHGSSVPKIDTGKGKNHLWQVVLQAPHRGLPGPMASK